MQRTAHFILLTVCLVGLMEQTARCQDAEKKDLPADAKTVHWRRDYVEARKEATKRKLPLYLLVIKDANPSSARYQREALQDPKIIALLNEQYIPLLVDDSDIKGRTLADLMGLCLFPTTLIASYDGHILRMKIGLLNADDLMQLLLPAKDPPAEPEKRPACD